MAKVLLQSSNLKSAEYDDKANSLTIEFHRGGTYQYLDVPPEIFTGLIDSPSAGSYLAKHIRNKFAFVKQGGQ